MENNNNSVNRAFFSYLTHPKINFETHEPTEKILLLLRAHPFTQLYWIINSIIFFIISIFIPTILGSFLNFTQTLFINFFAFVAILSYILFNFINWYFNVGIITNKRIIDIDFTNILYKEITVARLDKIQDLTVKSGGYFEAMFDFGTIFVQTAGSDANVEFNDVPYPSDVVQIVNKLLSRKNGN